MKGRMQVCSQRVQLGWRLACLAGYAVCIFTLSSIPGQALPSVHISDKLIHAGIFRLLGFLLCRALSPQLPTWRPSRIALLSLLLTIGYGATDELHQLFVPARSAEMADLIADGIGAALAVWGWLQWSARWTWLR